MRVNRTAVRTLPRATNMVAGSNKQALDLASEHNSHVNMHSSCHYIWAQPQHMLPWATSTLTDRGLRQRCAPEWCTLGTLVCCLSTDGGRACYVTALGVTGSRCGNGLVTLCWWLVLGSTWAGSVVLARVRRAPNGGESRGSGRSHNDK